MGLFDEVKQNVTVRQAVELYGLKPNRSGLIRCIFHNDKSPSMKVDRRYYCFGCGCTGDAIDFTAQLFGIGLKDAAMKLADDFRILYSGKDRESLQNKRRVPIKKPKPTPEELWQKKYLRCLRAYLNYRSLLLEWKEQYAPKTWTEEWNEKFMISLSELTVVEYYLDILLFGDRADKEVLVIKEIATKEQKDAMKEMLRMADKSKVDEVKQMLEYTQKGTAKATVGNYMVVLRNDPLVRESMKYNKLTGRIDIVKKLWWNEEICKLDDDGRTYFYYFFERYYKLTSEKCMDKALRIEANSRAYHPICEYLEQLEWDGQERIRYVLQRYMGADASDFVYEVVKHFLMEALSRIYRPGCKADEMLCLVGQQGAGKSTFFRFLALNDDWFSDDLKQLNDSKIYEHLRGHWIMEMSEMIAAISAKSNEEIKSFLTRQKDTYRNPYDKYEEDRKRQCIFAGSTNTRQFIPFDRTGARRFLPIAIDSSKAEKHILDDEKEARAYFDQLWAEAMEIYWSTENKSSLLKFSKEMEQKISEYRKQFTQEDTMAGMIQGWLDAYKGTHVCSVQIWKEAFDHFEREPKKFETNEICSIMDTQITGWKRDGIHRFSKEGYGRQRSWVREGTEEGGNEPDKDGFTKLTKAEQLELPFDLPDREKG